MNNLRDKLCSGVWADTKGNVYYTTLDGPIPLTPFRNSSGYWSVILPDKKIWGVSVIVLLTHKEDEYFPGAQADHINEDINDNRLENLRWITPQENAAKANGRQIKVILPDGFYRTYNSIRELYRNPICPEDVPDINRIKFGIILRDNGSYEYNGMKFVGGLR